MDTELDACMQMGLYTTDILCIMLWQAQIQTRDLVRVRVHANMSVHEQHAV